MDTLSETLQRVLAGYAGKMLNGSSYLTSNPEGSVYAIIDLAYIGEQHFVETGLVVRREHDTLIIEHDINSKPLVDALLEAGIPRGQIVLAYAGEVAPVAA